MNIIFTEHAEQKLIDREISKELIISALNRPSCIIDSKFGRKIVHKFINDKLLRIICDFEEEKYIIITAYYTKPQRYSIKEE